jgi:hypothetical protein
MVYLKIICVKSMNTNTPVRVANAEKNFWGIRSIQRQGFNQIHEYINHCEVLLDMPEFPR